MMGKLELMKYCLRQRCEAEDNWSLLASTKWLYTIKAIVTIALGRKFKSENNLDWDWMKTDPVTVAIHSFEKFYNFEFATDDAYFIRLMVGHGWLNWHYNEISDGWL